MLTCGCAAIAQHAQPHDGLSENHPSCPVHDCCEPQVAPDLTGRIARCAHAAHGGCKNERPSSVDLPFFKYRGPGSRDATDICVCGYAYVAHTVEGMARNVPSNRKTVIQDGRCPGGKFVARGPHPTDTYYCGC